MRLKISWLSSAMARADKMWTYGLFMTSVRLSSDSIF